MTSEIAEGFDYVLSGSSVYDEPPTLTKLRMDVMHDAAEMAHKGGSLWNPFNIKMVIKPQQEVT